MTTHKADAGPITLINVFAVDPEKLEPWKLARADLVDGLHAREDVRAGSAP